MTLAERLSLPKAQVLSEEPSSNPTAARRFRDWRAQSPFQDDGWFERRLELDRLKVDGFLHVLGESSESLGRRCPEPPVWLARLKEAFERFGAAAEDNLAGVQRSESTSAFLTVIGPLLREARERVRKGAEDLVRAQPAAPVIPDDFVRIFYSMVPRRLGAMMSQTAVLELHVAGLQGRLRGETAKERFQSFIDHLAAPGEAASLLAEYPVLARLLVEWLDLWVESSLEFLHRLGTDWDLLRSTFSPDKDPGMLAEVAGNMGDRHRRGRAVLIARFSSGFKIVYKPKPMAVDVHFAELLDWLNRCGAPALWVPRTVDRGRYGWSEFVSSHPCRDREDLQLFYRRLGALLGLLYSLEATDFHNENLIAAGGSPVLIDLESMFRAKLREADPSRSDSIAHFTLANSVLRVGLLPQRQWDTGGAESVELSGLGGKGGQTALREVPLWDLGGTDQMRLVRQRMKITPADNRPSLNGSEVNPLDFSQEILGGFTSMYRLLLSNRDGLLHENGPLAKFADDEVRAICRHTRFYKMILDESFHPDLLRNALDRDRIFDRLWYGAGLDSLTEKAIQLIPSERQDLWAGDIPFFSTRVDSRDIQTSGGETIPGFFEESGLEAVRSRLLALSDEDLRQQIWFVKGSLTTLAMETEPRRKAYSMPEQTDAAESDRFLQAAARIGERLEQLAFRGDRDASWIGLRILGGQHWTLTPAGLDLYSGLPGIALFLAYLGRTTGSERYTQLAEACLAGIRIQLEKAAPTYKAVGVFEGWAGLLYTYLHLAVLWGRNDLLAEAGDFLDPLQALIEIDESLDVVSGSAGAIVALLAFQRCVGSALALELACNMGHRLVLRAESADQGLGWRVQISPQRPLAGFSHGASGFAWALSHLYGTTGEETFKQAALQALAFESCVFSPDTGNWPDLREAPGEGEKLKFMTAWCHGAPGIGLSRLGMSRFLEEPEIRRDLRIALQTTCQQGFGGNHSLCHGDLGNLELLLEAGRTLPDKMWEEKAYRLGARILTSIEKHGHVCGVPQGVETPGLMNGLAGIGYGLLRLAKPDDVPSVLLLAGPR